MSLDEYITLCADLHNTLLAKSVSPNSPPPETSTDLLQRYESYRANPPSDTDTDTDHSLDPLSPLATLLSRLKTTIPPPTGDPTPLTPLLYQPMPEWFFLNQPILEYFWPPFSYHDFDDASPPLFLLYPQRLHSRTECPFDGGLFVDIYTLHGIWLQPNFSPVIPPSKKWLPLDYLLKLELSRWESGRYVHDLDAEDGLKIQKWLPVPRAVADTDYPNLQVAEAVSNWERLLGAIESKMLLPAPGETPERERGPPLRPAAIKGLRLSKFAEHFLTRASRPKGWTFVAPGIETFSEESLREVYTAETEDAFRRTLTASGEGEDWVTLVLPSVGSVPADVSRVRDFNVSGFDESYGFGKATVGRRAGLYTTWADKEDGDLVQLVCPSGRTNTGEFGGLCPWGPSRSPRLAEVLGHWANLVETGVWAVGEDGVKEDAGWFDSHKGLASLNWDDVSE